MNLVWSGLASERLHTFFVQGNRNIFAELPEEDWSLVLFHWGTDWMTLSGENRSVVQEYMMGLIDQRPEYLGRLLQCFVLGNVDLISSLTIFIIFIIHLMSLTN